jgi:hypothetical protein
LDRVSRAFFWDPGRSSWLPGILGIKVDDARDGSSRRCYVALARRPYLAIKPFHVGVDVDGLSCPLHRPMACSHQTRGQSFLPGAALSHRVAVGDSAFLEDVKPPSLDI